MRRTRPNAVASLAAIVAVTAVVAGLGVGVGAASDVSLSCVGSGGGAAYVTDSGLTVYENDSAITYGNFTDDQTVSFQNGTVDVSATGPASVRLDNATDSRTCLGDVDASDAAVTVAPDGRTALVVESNASAIAYRDPVYDTGDSAVDIAYNVSVALTLTINATGRSQGTTLVADALDSGTRLATGDVAADGSLTVTLDAGTHDIDLHVPTPTSGDSGTDGGEGGGSLFDGGGTDGGTSIAGEPTTDVARGVTDENSQQPGTTVELDGTQSVESITFDDGGTPSSMRVRTYADPPASTTSDIEAAVIADSGGVPESDGGGSAGDEPSGGAIGASASVVTVADIAVAGGDDTVSGTVTFTVDRAAVTNPQNLVVAHESADGWETLETTVGARGNDQVPVSARTESFSLFAVVEVNTTQETTRTPTEATTPTPTATESPTGTATSMLTSTPTVTPTAHSPTRTPAGTTPAADGPGFGPIVTIVALLAVLAGLARRSR